MKRMILNIMSTTGITLVVLAIVALCYGATVLFISAVFQALLLNVVIYIGIYIIDYFEYRYPLVQTGLKLLYVLASVLIFGLLFHWYGNMSAGTLIIMTIAIFVLCVGLDTISLRGEVKDINSLLKK